MRFNDRELSNLCLGDALMEGCLNYRKTPSGSFSQSGSGYKRRWFKLKNNLLFYFKFNESGKIEDKPVGVLVLEMAQVQLNLSGAQFAFSITFRDDPEKKHLFTAGSESAVYLWVDILQKSAYEYLRTQLITLQGKISRRTGKDPLLMVPRNLGAVRDVESRVVAQTFYSAATVKATFQSHLNLRFPSLSPSPSLEDVAKLKAAAAEPTVEVNLIEL